MLYAELNRTRRIGAEFEFTIPRIGSGSGTDVQRSIAECLSANGVRAIARSYQSTPVPVGCDVAVEYDGSVRGESRYSGIHWHSIEVKSRILNGIDDWERVIPQTLAICSYMGARVNRSCGHHVHVDFPEARERPTVIRSLYNVIHRFEPVIYSLVAPSRRSNGYAQPMPDRTRLLHGCRSLRCFQRALSHWDRRCGLNLTHVFEEEPRVEFRYHHGTLCVEKARHWRNLVLRLVDHATTRSCQAARQQVAPDRQGLDAFRYTIGLRSNQGIYSKVDADLRQTSKYLLRRWKEFNHVSREE